MGEGGKWRSSNSPTVSVLIQYCFDLDSLVGNNYFSKKTRSKTKQFSFQQIWALYGSIVTPRWDNDLTQNLASSRYGFFYNFKCMSFSYVDSEKYLHHLYMLVWRLFCVFFLFLCPRLWLKKINFLLGPSIVCKIS